ncbi:MATE family efflux transporter [Methanohalobium sp.]|uniref:MATE family efflux transporter n=1 Tax=Methanohalobium sp. TaxID=2837493 RepID=UPI0025E96D1B|nr:MATE family efflux transporter [Methanohalobium sp.]
MNDRRELLNNEKISNLLLKLSAPAIAGMVIQALYNIVDTIFVGKALGDASAQGIGGLTVAFPVQMIMAGLGLIIGIGGASIISRNLGSNNIDRAEKTLGNVIFLIFVFSALITVAVSLYINPIMKAFGATDTILPYAVDYLRIITYGCIFFIFAMATNNVVRAEGNANMAMFTMVIAGVTNIILDPVFIFGFGWGVKGAASATIISQIIGSLFLVYYLFSGKSVLKLHLKNLIPQYDIIKENITIGLSPFARQSSSSLMVVVLNNVLAIYGGDISIAVFGIINRLFMFIFMPMIGIVQGLQPIVGFNYGARNFERVMESVRLSIIVTTVMASIGFAIFYAFPEQLFGVFSNDPNLINSGKSAIRIMVLVVPLASFEFIGATLYQAIGKAKPSFVLSVSRQILFLIPLVIILPGFFDLKGVWIAFPIAGFLSFLLSIFMMNREFKVLKGYIPETGYEYEIPQSAR